MSQENTVQGIILAAGQGSRMSSIIGNKLKAVMPVGHFPMVYYPLKYLERNGFSEAVVVVNRNEVEKFKEAVRPTRLRIKTIIMIVDSEDELQTGETLRSIQKHLKANVMDVVIMSCDLITDVKFSDMYTHHVKTDANLTVLVGNNDLLPITRHPSDKGKEFKHTFITTEVDKKLVHLSPATSPENKIKLPKSVTDVCHPRLKIVKKEDPHMYIIKKGALNYLLDSNAPCSYQTSLKDELIPHLVACQFPETIPREPDMSSIEDYDVFWKKLEWVTKLNKPPADDKPYSRKNFCTTYPTEKLCLRVNTCSSFWSLNISHIPKLYSELGMNPNTTGIKMTLLDSVKQSKGKKFTKTVLGNDVTVGDEVQIKNSLIGDKVTIPDGCCIEDSVVLTSLERRVTLSKCIVSDWSLLSQHGDLDTYTDVIA